MAKDPKLLEAKEVTLKNLEILRTALNHFIDDGMVDEGDHYYNEILDLIADVETLDSWADLLEAIALAKALEIDIDVWLSRKGRTSISLPWPTDQ